MTQIKKAILLAFLALATGCDHDDEKSVTEKDKSPVELRVHQRDWTTLEIEAFPATQVRARETVMVRVHRATLSADFDSAGRAVVRIPVELSEGLRVVQVVYEDQIRNVPFRAQTVSSTVSCAADLPYYFELRLRCSKSIRTEVWPPGEPSAFDERAVPLDEKVVVVLGERQIPIAIANGAASIPLTREDVFDLQRNPVAGIRSSGELETIAVNLPPLDHQIVFTSAQASLDSFTGVVENRTLDGAVIRVTAGYRDSVECGLLRKLLDRRCVGAMDLTLRPGESKKLQVVFDRPFSASDGPKWSLDVISRTLYAPDAARLMTTVPLQAKTVNQ